MSFTLENFHMKRTLILALVCLLVLSSNACALDTEALRNNLQPGEILRKSSLVWFAEGIVCLRSNENGLCGYVDLEGNIISPPQWDLALAFHEGFSRVEKDGLFGYIDTSGACIIEPRWNNASSAFTDGIAFVEINGEGTHIIDIEGNLIL